MDDPVAKLATRASQYERDFYAWTQEQAALLRERRPNAHDWANIAEEIESLGRSDRREIASRLTVLLHHLLKWEFQPSERSSSWTGTIVEQRRGIKRLIKESPSLKTYPAEILAEAYDEARDDAIRETELPAQTFSQVCPYPINEILDHDFLP